jgi:hypothetical protein
MSVNVLGARKTRQLARLTGLDLDRAVLYSHGDTRQVEGRVVAPDGHCIHFAINRKTGEWSKLHNPLHWTSCPEWGHHAPEEKP